jgi:hypothetical protein
MTPMHTLLRRGARLCALLLPLAVAPAALAQEAAGIPRPAEVIGFRPGEDYKLADNDQLLAYYRRLADASDRVRMEEIGRSTAGRPMVLLTISSPENLARLGEWRAISERLGRARGLTDDQARALARQGKAVVWIDAGLHSTEVATSQHVPHLAHHLATDETEETRRIRDEVVVLLMPMMNPDGHEIVVDWYREQLGTPWETTAPPELYHRYVGHDINRDLFMFRQTETRHVARVLYEEWYPQIVFNHHQIAPFPARIFIPPFADPVNPHIDPRVVRGVNLVGEHMANRFARESKPGVVSRMTFTMWWNGGMRTAPYFHNMLGILSEVAHASATPAEHDPANFPETFGTGSWRIPTLEPTVYYPDPWRGGRATLGEAVEYHLTASLGALDVAMKNREDFLYTFYLMGRDAIRAGEAGGPFAYVVSLADQHDPGEAVEMLTALRRGGIEVHRATSPFQAGGRRYPAGSYVLYAAQAFRAHLLDMMEPQEHPHRATYPGGPPEPPYGGLAGYTLPIAMGVRADRIDAPFHADVAGVAEVAAPEGSVTGRGSVFLVDARHNAGHAALHRLAAAGASLARATAPFDAGGVRHPAGTLVVRGADAEVRRTAAELGLRVAAVPASPRVALKPVRPARIAVYRSWVPNMDEGWSRWLLTHYGIPFEVVGDDDVRGGVLARFDAVLLASASADSIAEGYPEGSRPPGYTGGLGEEGVAALRGFVEGGGRLVALDRATDFAVERFGLPVRNVLAGVRREAFFIPGSLVRITVDETHPVGYGMQRETAAFFQSSRAFEVTGPGPEVVARYGERDLLLSGWEVGAAEHLTGRVAATRVPVGAGDVVLIGFRPQFRAQPAATFPLLFNALQGAAEGDRTRPRVAAATVSVGAGPCRCAGPEPAPAEASD